MSDTPATPSQVGRLKAELEQLKAEAARLRVAPAAESPKASASAPLPSAKSASSASDPRPAKTPSPSGPPAANPARVAPPPLPAASATKAPATTSAAATGGAEEEEILAGRRGVYQTLGSFSTSMVVHFILLLAMSLWMIPELVNQEMAILTVAPDRPQEELTKVLEEDMTPSVQLDVTSSAATHSQSSLVGAGGAEGTGGSGGGSGAPVMDSGVLESIAGTSIALNDISGLGMPGDSLNVGVPEGSPGEPSIVVDGYQDAMDRITQEILGMLLKGDVLVMWLFDQSESMKDDQQEIKTRIDRVYSELGLTEAAQGDALLTSVGSFGSGFAMHTAQPTYKLEDIRAAIDAVPLDPTGLEYTCTSIGRMIELHRKFASSGRRQLAIILVSDESGEEQDNYANVEAAIAVANDTRCPIYILGREAVFGYPYCYMNWVHAETGLNFWLQINRGPETPSVEQLQTDGFHHRWDAHPSGFGPYEHTRMARETGGVFFLLPSPEVNLVARDDRKYELNAMRPYLPDLGPRDAYLAEREKSELRRTVAKVIDDLNPYVKELERYLIVPSYYSIDPVQFRASIAVELEEAKQFFLYLDAAEKELDRIKDRRDNEPNPRWRANYDLLYAQVIAYKVRMYEYGAFMQAFAEKPKRIKNPLFPVKTNYWALTTRAETLTDEETSGYRERSRQMLEQIVNDHPGTPWAARAQWELVRGFGVDLVEHFEDPRRIAIGLKVPKL